MKIICAICVICGFSALAEEYLILSQPNEAYARGLSRKLFQLARPNPAARDVTTHWASVIKHSDGRVSLVFPDELLPLSMLADTNALPDAIGAALPAAQRDKLRADILANRGKRVAMKTFLPVAFVNNLKTREQMRADGWFP